MGGLGGIGVDLFDVAGIWEPSRRSVPLTVDEDDEEVKDSRTAVRPRLRTMLESSCRGMPGTFRLVTGGRLRVGLSCFLLIGALTGVETPGDCDDMDVGVEVLLKAPGDSERRMEEPLSAKVGVGGGNCGVDKASGRLRVL